MSAAQKLTELLDEVGKEQTRPYGQYIAERVLETYLVNNAEAFRDLIEAAEHALDYYITDPEMEEELSNAIAKLKEPA